MPLPVRSYDFLVKDIDATLLSGIYRLQKRGAAGGRPAAGVGTRLRPIAPELLAAIGGPVRRWRSAKTPMASVRRINQRRCQSATSANRWRGDGQASRPPGFAHRHDRLQRRRRHRVHPGGTVLGWVHRGEDDKLQALVKGRAVVVASLLPTESRHRLPVSLAGWEPGSRTEPGPWCTSRPCAPCSAAA
jgi:hypothetical protein